MVLEPSTTNTWFLLRKRHWSSKSIFAPPSPRAEGPSLVTWGCLRTQKCQKSQKTQWKTMVSAHPYSKMSKNSMKNNGFGTIDHKHLVSASQTTLELQIYLRATQPQSWGPELSDLRLSPNPKMSKKSKKLDEKQWFLHIPTPKCQKTQWKAMVLEPSTRNTWFLLRKRHWSSKSIFGVVCYYHNTESSPKHLPMHFIIFS